MTKAAAGVTTHEQVRRIHPRALHLPLSSARGRVPSPPLRAMLKCEWERTWGAARMLTCIACMLVPSCVLSCVCQLSGTCHLWYGFTAACGQGSCPRGALVAMEGGQAGPLLRPACMGYLTRTLWHVGRFSPVLYQAPCACCVSCMLAVIRLKFQGPIRGHSTLYYRDRVRRFCDVKLKGRFVRAQAVRCVATAGTKAVDAPPAAFVYQLDQATSHLPGGLKVARTRRSTLVHFAFWGRE